MALSRKKFLSCLITLLSPDLFSHREARGASKFPYTLQRKSGSKRKNPLRIFFILLLAATTLLYIPLSAWADTVTYQQGDGKGSPSDTDDSWLEGDSTSTNHGAELSILVDDSPNYHAVIKFPNIFGGGANQIPLGSTINSATLTLVVFDPGSDISVYQITESWVESQVTWNSRSSGVSWSNAGCDGTGSHKSSADDTFSPGSNGTYNRSPERFQRSLRVR